MFSQFFIHRPIFACVISIVIVVVGGISIPMLPVEQTPDITPPTVTVNAKYPGASAQVIADTVAAPIEEQVNGVEDMIYMSSKSSDDGSMTLTVTFEVGTDIDMAAVLVQNRVAIAEPKLPEEVRRQGITTKKQSTNIVLMITLTSPDETYDEIFISNYITTRIKDVLGRIPGVGEVTVFGAKDFGMRIWLDPDLLRVRDLTVADVIGAVREQNVQVAAGQIGGPPSPPGQEFQYTVNTLGRLSSVEEFENIIIKVGEQARTLRLKDVARVELGAQAYHWSVNLNGAPAIALGVYQLPGANSLAVAKAVRAEMDRLAADFPQDLEYQIPYDTTKFVSASIREVINTLIIAVLLVILTVYVFLQDIRTTLVPAITIPVALIGTFGVMLGIGLSINTLSLFGLVLAIGIVVDDAIVVVENTMRIIDEEKLPTKEATAKAMRQVSGPVVATTLVLLAVFVPTGLIGGITGRLYQQFALTISTATVFSSINALTLSPALCGILLRPSPQKRGWFFNLFNKSFNLSSRGYSKIVGMAVRRTAIVMLLFAVVVGLMIHGFRIIPTGFIPYEDQGVFIASVQLPDAATLERTGEILERVDGILRETPGVKDYITIAGYSILDGLPVTNGGAYFVSLEPWGKRTDPSLHVDAILRNVNHRLAGIQDGVALAFSLPPIAGLGTAGGFEFQLQDRAAAGINLLETVAKDIVFAGMADPVVTRMNNSFRAGVPQIYLDIDRVKAKKLGVSLDTVFTTLGACLGSAYVNDFNLFGRVYRVMLQADFPYRSSIDDIGRLQVRDREGNMIPLETLMDAEETAGPQAIFRYNLYPSALITGQPNPGYSSGQAIQAMQRIASEKLPPSMGYEWTGVTYQEIKAGASAIFIFAFALVFVYLFLAAQYESWSIPFSVIFSVPLAIFGAILATYIRSFDNNVYTQIGFVLLIGLSAKSAILIVEFAKQLRAEGKSITEAAATAAHIRFRAILMTAFSFILGVFPLVIASGAGASSRRSLGTAVFGGMLVATILGVFLIPVLYVVVQRVSEGIRRKKPENSGEIS